MYDELIGRLRANGELFLKYIPNAEGDVLLQAADAIEELQGRVKVLEKVADKWCEAVPKWIQVSERLPEENGRYLVRYKRDIVLDYTEVHDDEVRIMRFFVDDGWRYPFLCQPELRKAEQQTVTHWMVLPNLPAEENANG